MSEQNGLEVSGIIHKAVIDVNEDGTTAAAASGTLTIFYVFLTVFIPFLAIVLDIRISAEIVTVDRPFLFMLKSPEHIFFIGRVVDPKYE